ncbi:MarR family winged helix-turn-helix transcriptional regulator [Streptomyces sp. CBMA29]|uniref:MarR family winged helix-turn-helix transcriptional regulator n=1 Tax=Streptomyces sp. CBMA29 TaxID=1896314 RepID=UPI0016618F0D|nr:MarR family transcriptional regulator [Streptomyces sp. CBMA29]MBD0734821.1 MarR family transcriptional regulator [Streptomyces sp. CBMA29]
MPHIVPPHRHEQVAHDASAVSELLEVLWGRGQEAAPSGPLSPSQVRALFAIEQYEGANLRTLGDALGSRPSSVSRLCDRLEAVGLVDRQTSPTSRREVELRLTRRGHAALAEFRDFRAREVKAVLGRMAPDELAALAEGLTAFRRAAAGAAVPGATTADPAPRAADSA